ncbi:MAG: thiol-disulfide oxidoreductase DCC family protein, partial [Gemmatimonadales bacterium]
YQVGADPVILFDGECRLCNGAVAFVVKRDPRAAFRYVPLQSEASKELLRSLGVALEALPDSMVLVDSDGVHVRSTATLRIARRMRFPWLMLYALILVPRPLRDWAYDFIAAHRHR